MAKSIVQRLNDIVNADSRAQDVIAVEIGISKTKLREALAGQWPVQHRTKSHLENWLEKQEAKKS